MKKFIFLAIAVIGTLQTSAYTYKAPKSSADISWLALGNGNGKLLAVENPVGLPIISVLRWPASGISIINGRTQLAIDYTDPSSKTRSNWSPWNDCFSDGMQPVVSYEKNGVRHTVWPMDMIPISREWVDESNILRTVIGNSDFELTVDDFVPSQSNELVRTFTVKNLMSDNTSFRIIHFAPINPSGRSLQTWHSDWLDFDSTNTCVYDATNDCLLFTNNNSDWWVMGSDSASSGHQCGMYGNVANDIKDGTLSDAKTTDKGVIEGALSYDSPPISQNKTYSVNIFLSHENGTVQTAGKLFKTAHNKEIAETYKKQTIDFWQNWLASGSSATIKDPEIRTIIRRLLMVLKSNMWDNGGISAVSAEASMFYARDGVPTAQALALFGYTAEAKRMMLAYEAYMLTNTYMNAQLYDSTISDKIKTGFSESTKFANSKSFSLDTPPLFIYTIGNIWQIDNQKDTAFITQTWPFVKHLIAIGLRDMGPIGVIAQNNGFQDDMLHWSFLRQGKDGNPVGIECSYFNMLWVSAIEKAAEMGKVLGHTTEAESYSKLAKSIRKSIEDNFWNEEKQRYAYIRVPDSRAIAGEFSEVSDGKGGRYIFPKYVLNQGASLPIWFGYSEDAHAKESLKKAKDPIIPLPENDVVTGNYRTKTVKLTRVFYGLAKTKDSALEATKDWFIKNAPLGGIPQNYPTHKRAVQVWMCGETMIALNAYLDATGQSVGVINKFHPVILNTGYSNNLQENFQNYLFTPTGRKLLVSSFADNSSLAKGCYIQLKKNSLEKSVLKTIYLKR